MKLVVTTSWDDGSKLDLKLVKLLDRYGIKGTFYIPKSYRDDSLGSSDIVVLDRRFEVGAHTLSHADLTGISLSDAKQEISGSKAYLEGLLGHKVDMFCYPKGHCNRNVKQLVADAGFIAARTTNYGNFRLADDPFAWHVTLQASNGSPFMSVKTWLKSGVSAKSLIDWEIRARLLFDLALQEGGVYHLWGHSWEIEQNGEWAKLERVLQYISDKKSADFMPNGEIFRLPQRLT